MFTRFVGTDAFVQGFRWALDGGKCRTPNVHVRLVHWDDFETRAILVRRARERGTDLIFLRMEQKAGPNTVTVAGLCVSIHVVLALGGRYTARHCMPWVRDEKLTFLIPVDEGYSECFVMGTEGQYIGSDGKPEGKAFDEGLPPAIQWIERCVQICMGAASGSGAGDARGVRRKRVNTRTRARRGR